jgi:hypothetical protein
VTVSKTVVVAISPRVRIPPSPLVSSLKALSQADQGFFVACKSDPLEKGDRRLKNLPKTGMFADTVKEDVPREITHDHW